MIQDLCVREIVHKRQFVSISAVAHAAAGRPSSRVYDVNQSLGPTARVLFLCPVINAYQHGKLANLPRPDPTLCPRCPPGALRLAQYLPQFAPVARRTQRGPGQSHWSCRGRCRCSAKHAWRHRAMYSTGIQLRFRLISSRLACQEIRVEKTAPKSCRK